jgi:type I restriction enzyme S subunit
MPEPWTTRSIGECLSEEFPGEWGDAPSGGGNATVLRSTDIDDEGHVALRGGARRTISRGKLIAKKLQSGDILLEASGGGPGKPVGRVALFKGGDANTYLSSNFFRTLRPNRNLVDATFRPGAFNMSMRSRASGCFSNRQPAS